MKIGLQITSFTWPGGTGEIAGKLAEIAASADEAGFASIWVMDHFFQLEPMLGPVDDPMLEAYSALTYLAAVTKRARLGTMVTGAIYRYPAFLVKQVTNLDVLSGGRAYFGVGAGWYEREAKGLGFPFPPLKERFERLEETLQIAHQMWSGNVGAYDGAHNKLAETICSPLPISKPHPPILVGGGGEKKTLRFVAQYGNACNFFLRAGAEIISHKLDVLKRHCADLGRPYDEIERTLLGTVHLADGEMSAGDVTASCREMADLGVQHIIFNMPNVHEMTPLKIFGDEIIPAVAGF
jgi:F420-dependent oxidoreductase-like protein